MTATIRMVCNRAEVPQLNIEDKYLNSGTAEAFKNVTNLMTLNC